MSRAKLTRKDRCGNPPCPDCYAPPGVRLDPHAGDFLCFRFGGRGRKRRYCNRSHAERELLKLRAQGRTERRAYRCPACRGWHLTSTLEIPTTPATINA